MEKSFHIRDVYPADENVFGETDERTYLKNLYNRAQFDTELISLIADQLGLLFLNENTQENLCYANNNDDLRDEFKQVFSKIDLCDYIVADTAGSFDDFLKSEIILPKDSDEFWTKVRKGAAKRVSAFSSKTS